MDKHIVFLPVPKNLHDQLSDEFPINEDIPIPADITGYYSPDEQAGKLKLENLSVEMIVSGMLCAIEQKFARQEWLDYYSAFVLYLRPDILIKLQEIKDRGLDDESFIKAHNLIQEGNTEEGLIIIRGFIERFPLVWNGWFILGWALRRLGRYKDGEAALRKAIELGGDNKETQDELEICLRKKNG